jgi:hypothetical protein
MEMSDCPRLCGRSIAVKSKIRQARPCIGHNIGGGGATTATMEDDDKGGTRCRQHCTTQARGGQYTSERPSRQGC